MSYRITRQTLDNLLAYVAKDLGLPKGHYKRNGDGKYSPLPRGLDLDHNPHYGGYEVQMIDPEGSGSTGVNVISGDRKSAREMYAWLQGALAFNRLQSNA